MESVNINLISIGVSIIISVGLGLVMGIFIGKGLERKKLFEELYRETDCLEKPAKQATKRPKKTRHSQAYHDGAPEKD